MSDATTKPAGDLFSLGKVLYEISVGRDRQDFPALPEKWEQFADQEPDFQVKNDHYIKFLLLKGSCRLPLKSSPAFL